MSVSYYAHTLIGVRVPIDKLYRKEYKKHTAHSYPDGANYCPVCGQKTQESVLMIPLFDEHNFKIGNFDVVILEVGRDQLGFVGLDMSVKDWEGPRWDFRGCRRMDYLEKELKAELLSRGMWDEDIFGIYTFLDIV